MVCLLILARLGSRLGHVALLAKHRVRPLKSPALVIKTLVYDCGIGFLPLEVLWSLSLATSPLLTIILLDLNVPSSQSIQISGG